jgi:tricarballylate dehydrogenase
MVNTNGRRFVDEGADFRNYTYAKYGAEIMKQPGQFAWQIFDAKMAHLLRDEYHIRQITKVTANSLEDLAGQLDCVDAEACLAEINAYNLAIRDDIPFNPNIKDGRRTEGLPINKSNWANALNEPPFEAFAVTCGITFTFGGLRVDTGAQVLDSDLRPIPGLYAAGELVGGIFYNNYPGGAGLMSGAVFGKIAGASSAREDA